MSFQSRVLPATAFSVGRVLMDSFRVLGRNFVPFFLITLLLNVLIHVAIKPAVPVGLLQPEQSSWPEIFIYPLVNLIVTDINLLALMFVTLRTLRGERPATRDYILGLISLPSVIALSIIFWVPSIIASLIKKVFEPSIYALLGIMIVFGIIALIMKLMLWVAAQAVAVERRNVLGGLRRSVQLTKERRWKILGLSMIVGIVVMPFVYLIAIVSGTPMQTLVGAGISTLPGVLMLILGALTGAFGLVLGTVSYHHLRIDKDGVDVDRVVTVFD